MMLPDTRTKLPGYAPTLTNLTSAPYAFDPRTGAYTTKPVTVSPTMMPDTAARLPTYGVKIATPSKPITPARPTNYGRAGTAIKPQASTVAIPTTPRAQTVVTNYGRAGTTTRMPVSNPVASLLTSIGTAARTAMTPVMQKVYGSTPANPLPTSYNGARVYGPASSYAPLSTQKKTASANTNFPNTIWEARQMITDYAKTSAPNLYPEYPGPQLPVYKQSFYRPDYALNVSTGDQLAGTGTSTGGGSGTSTSTAPSTDYTWPGSSGVDTGGDGSGKSNQPGWYNGLMTWRF